MSGRNKYDPVIRLVTLDCGHTVEYRNPAPQIGQRVYCRQCIDWHDVTGMPSTYRARCQGCTYARSYGLDRDRVLAAASKHVIRRAHTVEIYLGRSKVDTVSPDPGQGSLPFETSLTERQAESRDSQQALRTFMRSLPNRYDQNA